MGGLSGILAEVERIMGREIALKLALHLGGGRIYVPTPERMKSSHVLIRALGGDIARELASHLSGEEYFIPLARSELITHMAGKSLSRNEIAVRLGVSKRTVQRHLSRRPDEGESTWTI